MARNNSTDTTVAAALDGETRSMGPLSADGPLTDAAQFNAIPDPVGPGLPDLADPGETIRGKPVYGLTGDWDSRAGVNNVRTQLDSGRKQDTSDGVITYGFFDHKHALGLNNNPGFGEGAGYTSFTDAQKAAARVAIKNWDELISATFKELGPKPGASDWASNQVDIWLANTTTGPAQAWAYYPGYGQQYVRVAGDVWIADPRVNGSNNQLLPGFYGLQTLNHELGHALGLSHPGDYNFGDDQDGDGEPDPITYEGDAFYFQDSHQYSIMSYFDSFETGAQNIDWNLMRFVYPSTPMVHDVAIIQAKYGADVTTRTGNTTYGFNATPDVTNPAMVFKPGEMATIFTIWDAGGNDTLDLSGFRTPSVIDLRPGAYSSAGGWGAYNSALIGVEPTLAQINANNAAAGLGNRSTRLYEIYFNGDWSDDGGQTYVNEGLSWKEITGTGPKYLMEDNIGIAYGAIIENAIGGHGDDRINGNQANNRLTGNGGADTFVFVDDGSVDTITDFQTGLDRIDLSEVTVTGFSWDAAQSKLFVNTDADADYELTIIVQGSPLNTGTDLFFG